ncbi:MAG: hypothetical protein Q7K54_05685 [Candidatus Parcubacteria bacterium]|nr:hypothetical protein [Candidatus Parcubacteria bacterium]
MKKIITFLPIFFFLALFLFNTKDVFASICSQEGNTTFCDDGTNYSQIGNTIFGSDGSNYSTIGNTTFGNDGSHCSQTGNTTFCNDGTNYSQIDNTIFGSDGTNYSRIGNTTFGSSGSSVLSSCPANSSYDSLSSKCKCNYGYVVSGSSCVYKSYTPTYTPSYTPTYPPTPTYTPKLSSCPLNSYSSNGSCYCSTGYKLNSDKTSCIVAPIKTNYQSCQDTYGINSYSPTSGKCGCSVGYKWSTDGKSCVFAPTKTNEQICQDSFGLNIIWDGTKNSDNTLNCNCKTSYEWATDRKSCVKIIPLVIPKPASVSSSKKIVATQTEEEKKKQNSEAQTKIGNAVLAEFIKEHPEYAPENDPNDVKWNLFKEKIASYDWSNKTTEQLKEIFESIHKNITEKPKINQTQEEIAPNSAPEKKLTWYQKIFNWFK